MKIKDWNIQGGIPGFYIYGTSYGHPRFNDGGPLHSSSVRILDLDKSEAHTLNSLYELENTKHKPCLLSRCGGDLCCFISPAIHCENCLLVGCKTCFADTDALLVKSCNTSSKMHKWNILGVK